MALRRGIINAKQLEVSDSRSLARDDLKHLLEKRPEQQLQSIRDSHHRVARAAAAGLSNIDIAAHCGCSVGRVSQLKKDPSFIELTAHYRGLITAEYIQQIDPFMEVATANMLKAASLVSDRLDAAMEEGAKDIPLTQLMAIADSGADRFGYGKMQKNLNVNVDFAAQLEAARKRSGRARDISPSLTLAPAIEHQAAHHQPVRPSVRSDPSQNAPAHTPAAAGQSNFRRL